MAAQTQRDCTAPFSAGLEGLILTKPPPCYCQGRAFDLLASGHVSERKGIDERWFARSWATACSLQDLLQVCLWAEPGKEGRWGSAHSSLAIISLLPAAINLIWFLSACLYECTVVLFSSGKGLATHQRIYSLTGHYRKRAGKGSSMQKGY